jgi:hypothetical protein
MNAGTRLGRSRSEAQVLASLNHPNIAAIYGLDEAGNRLFLVPQPSNFLPFNVLVSWRAKMQ